MWPSCFPESFSESSKLKCAPICSPRGSEVRLWFLNRLNWAVDWVLLLGNEVEVSTESRSSWGQNGVWAESHHVSSCTADQLFPLDLAALGLAAPHPPREEVHGSSSLLMDPDETHLSKWILQQEQVSCHRLWGLLPEPPGLGTTCRNSRNWAAVPSYVILGKSRDVHPSPLIYPL